MRWDFRQSSQGDPVTPRPHRSVGLGDGSGSVIPAARRPLQPRTVPGPSVSGGGGSC